MAVYAIGLAGWMLVIFAFSSQPLSKQDMKPWLARQVAKIDMERWFGGVRFEYGELTVSLQSLGPAGFAEFFIRKASHFAEYAVLASLLYLTLRLRVRKAVVLLPVVAVLCLLFAVTDEFHQAGVAGRTPLRQDVLLDTTGACFGLLACQLAARFGAARRRRRARRAQGEQREQREQGARAYGRSEGRIR